MDQWKEPTMRKWWPLVAICAGACMLLVDVTIVNVALPDMARQLHTTFSDLQWVIDLYALVLGALIAGSEYSWGTLKTVFTQRPGRLATLTGRLVVFQVWMAIMTAIIFGVGAGYSAVIASFEGHAIVWPAAIDIVKGIGAIWLVLAVNGSLGMALGALFRQSAAALGVGLIYVTVLQIILVRFIASFNGGTYKWITNWFDGQNATALLNSFTSPAFGRATPPAIGAEQAVLTLAAYLVFFIVASAALLRQRDVT